MPLLDDLEKAEAELARIKREIAQGPCREFGHTWVLRGGTNAGCGDGCQCSVSLHVCTKCGDCDYGDNQEADEIRTQCASKEARHE